MEPTELEGIEWRPVTELVRQYGEHYHTKPRPRPRRREMKYEEEFEQVRPKKKRSYLPYVAIGLLAVAAVAYFLHRRQRASLHPSSGSPLGVPTNVTPVAPSVSPTPPPTSQQSTPKSSPSQSEKPTTTPIVADWSEKLRII
jgi:cytoskeletal protein RodZ